MDDKNHQSILMKSPFGYAYHKIIVDKHGKPTDYEFLEVNPAFERITGLKAKEIIGKTVCEVLPGIRENDFDCVQFYGDIAIDGGEGEFEQYSKQLGSWYKVQAYSDRKYYFSTVFTDVTAQKSLSDIAATFNNFSAQTIDIQYLADKAREISGAAYAVLNKFDEDGRGSSTLAFSGMNKHIEKTISMLGFDPRGKRWDYDPERQKKIDNQKTTVFQQITDLTGTAIPEKIITLISKTLNIGQVAVVKTTRENIMLGDFTLIFKRGSQLKNRETLETYADLTGMLLSRIDEERKVINEQARLKTITGNMTDVVWESDLQSKNTYTSPSVNRILGFSVEEYMPLTLEERLAPESLQISLSLLQEELEKENDPRVSKSRSRLVELKYYKKDGSLVPLESNISFIRDKNGNPVGLRGVSRDITERKQAEEALRTSEKKYRGLVEGLNDAVYRMTLPEGRYEYLSPSARDVFGYTSEEFINNPLLIRSIIHPDSAGYFEDKWKELLDGKVQEAFEYEIIDSEGKKRWIVQSNKATFDDSGRIKVIEGLCRDITGRKQAENELIKAKEKAEESDRLKTAFINNISHEVRTPLNGIIGFSELLNSPAIDAEKQKHFTGVIIEQGWQLASIIDDIITISSLETRQEQLRADKVDVNRLIGGQLALFAMQAEKKGLRMTSGELLAEEDATVYADKARLGQIFNNLILNALKFTDHGEVVLGCQKHENQLWFYVRDTGIGIDKSKTSLIFERFAQANDSIRVKYGGTGLGLSICKGFVELMGGEIWVESEPEKGSAFWFTIPYKAVKEIKTDIPKTPEVEVTDKPVLVLVAEDEEYNYEYLRALLELLPETMNLRVVHAVNGQQAVDICRDQPIDIVLMDIKMPIMDGHTATKQIREFKPNLPIIAQTAYALKSEMHQYGDVFDAYISKPFTLEKLRQTFSKFVNVMSG